MKFYLSLIFFISLNVNLASAYENSRHEKTDYIIAPYFWQTTSETAVVSDGGYVVPFELDVEDVLRATEKGAAFVFEARRGKYVLTSEVTYIEANHINTDIMTPIGEIPLVIDSKAVTIELWMGRHFGNNKDWIELYLGARQVENKADSSALGQTIKTKHAWDEPLLGVQTHLSLSDRWAWNSRLSVGEFSEENSSYDFSSGFIYHVSKSLYLITGYRKQKLEHNEKGEKPYHIETYGPYIAFGYKY